jgi:sugar lactone lactonase YvrE
MKAESFQLQSVIVRVIALWVFASLAAFAPPAAAQGIITTVAGGGGVQNGTAVSVLLPHPVDVAKDSLGNLFILSDATAAVYKVDSSGHLTVYAGNGLQSGITNGVQATSSSLNGPEAIAIDPAGNLIIADQGPSVVQRVDASTGIITVIAGSPFNAGFSGDGGPATNALLNRPGGVAVDANGNIFIGDAQNFRVRRIDVATGIITTMAGNGKSGFSGDGGLATSASLVFGGPFNRASIAVDGVGNLFIADSQNNRIRRVDASTHIITTVVGNGSFSSGDGGPAVNAGLSFPLGVAVDGSGNLFIADTGGERIREVNASTKVISTIAGSVFNAGFSGDGGLATGATVSFPAGVTVDGAGNVFIADTNNNRTRKVDTAGIITTAAGNGSLGDGGPATGAALYFPNAVAADQTGNLYIADTVNEVVRRVDAVTGVITHLAGVNGFCGFNGDSISATSAQLCGPDGVAVDGSGNLFISDSGNNRIRRVDAVTGTITTVAGNGTSGFNGDGGSATSASLAMPSGVALDNAGNVFIDDANNNRIRRVDSVSGIITTVAGDGSSGFGGDGGLATNAALSLSSPFSGPGGLAVDAAGNVFFTDVGNARIRRFDAVTGVITTVAGSASSCNVATLGDGGAATSASLCFPQGVAVDPRGVVYISDNGFSVGYQRIRRVDAATSIITTIAGAGFGGFRGDGGLSTVAGFEFLRGIALFGASDLFVVDSNALRIRRIAFAPAPPPTTASFFTDSSVTQTVSGGELIVHKELSGFPNYGAADGAADILNTGQAATWHFPVPASTSGLSCAHFQVSVIADGHYGVPPSSYQFLVWVDGKLDATPPPTLPHGIPAASRFTNWVLLNYPVSVVTSPLTITLANASGSTGPGDFIAVDSIELHIPTSCTVSSSAVKLVSAEFRGFDFAGVTTPTFSGPESAATALDPVFGAADVWNPLNIPQFPALDVNPSWSNLLDSTGAQTPVSFSITGAVGGVSLYAPAGILPGFVDPDPLRSVYLFFSSNSTTNPGESTTIQWQITGLAPNAAYDMCVYGARADFARSFNMTIGGTTLNVPTLLFNDPSPSSCVLFRGILSEATGTISGVGTGIGSPVGFQNEANWSGFQIAPSRGFSFSLSDNWSSTTNPNGPWSYNQGSAPLPLVADWTAANSAFVGCNQPAWAPSNSGGNFLPAVMNANSCTAAALGTDPVSGLPNVMPGDIVTHTVDPFNGNPANGVANVLFTLPGGDDGQYEIRGSVWDAGLFFGATRPQDWKLLIRGAQVASGVLSGTVSRSQAETFDVFANLAAGDTVNLQLVEDPNATAGFFVGTNLSIAEVPTQMQTTWTLSGVTFAGGGTASGSFAYDATSNTFSSINITVTGAAFGDATYTALDPGFPSTSTELVAVPSILADFTNTPVLALDFTSPLTNSGGTVALGTSHGIQVCSTATCSVSTIVSSVATGQVTAATGQMQMQTTPPVTFNAAADTTVSVVFNNTPGQHVEGEAIFPATSDLIFPAGIDPTTFTLQETNRFVSNAQPYTIGTPFATAIPFDHAGNDAMAGTTGNGAKYEIICSDATHPPAEANCPIPNPGKHIRFKDIFDLPKDALGHFMQPVIAFGTTVSFVHWFPNFHPEITSWSASSISPHPACTSVFLPGTPTFQCDFEDPLVNKYGAAASFASDTRKGDYLLVYNVPMLLSAVKVNGTSVNTPGIQGSSVLFVRSPLTFDFLVSPAQCPTGPMTCANGWIAAPVNDLFYTFDSLGAAPDLPGTTNLNDLTNCPGTNCNVTGGTPGASSTANVEFTTTPAIPANDGKYLLQWSAADTVRIRERNVQILPAGSATPCPNPFPDEGPAPTPPCYSTKLFSAQIDVDNTAPTITGPTLSSPNAVTPTTVTATYSCADPVVNGVASGIATCGTHMGLGGVNPTSTFVDTLSNAVGPHNFSVMAKDVAGNSKTSPTVNYTVYKICALYDQTKAVRAGAVIPIKLFLCNSSGTMDLSNSSIVVHATGLFQKSTSTSDAVIAAGNANPDNDFRFDPTLGSAGGYIFNLRTSGLGTGNWVVQFTVSNDPTLHSLGFGIN